jgi:hypothetical protein
MLTLPPEMRSGAPLLSEDERSHMDRVVDSLTRCFEGSIPRDVVEQSVDDSLAEFHDARITVHLPVLVERFAKRRLEALAEQSVPVAVSRNGR